MKIPIKKFEDDVCAPVHERFDKLLAHHTEETTWMVGEIRRLEIVLAAARHVRRGCDCDYDDRCGRCQAAINVRAAIDAYDAQATTV